MSVIASYIYKMKIGNIKITANEQAVIGISLLPDCTNTDSSELLENKWTKQAFHELTEYLEGKRREFTIPLEPRGTDFQKKVWKALLSIPYGETRSYREIAEFIGNEKACRAVGMANNKNPFMIVVPCHRVIGTNGKLTGYAGGLDIKQQLLELEKTGLRI